MSIIRTSVLALLLVGPAMLAAPSSAAPNTGKYQQSSEAMRKQVCSDFKVGLDVAEKEADKRAGTKAAAKYAKEADRWWADANKLGCSWAQ